jgi:ketosteroid isomerase-like protein
VQVPASGNTSQVLAGDRNLVEAWEKTDLATMEKLLAEDFVCVGPDGRIAGKPAYISGFRKLTPEQKAARANMRFSRSEPILHVYGNTGIVVQRSIGRKSGLASTTVWVLINGEWKAASFHGSSIVGTGPEFKK